MKGNVTRDLSKFILSDSLIKNDALVCKIALLFFICALPYVPLFIILNLRVSALIVVFTMSAFAITIPLVKLGHSTLGKLVLIISPGLAFFACANILSPLSGAQFLLFTLVALPPILFDLYYLNWIISTTLIPVALYVILELGNYQWINYQEQVPLHTLKIIHISAIITTFILLTMSAISYLASRRRYEIKIEDQNTKLQESNTQLINTLNNLETSNRRLNKHLNLTKKLSQRIQNLKDLLEADLEKGRKLQYSALPQSPPKMQDIVISHAFDPAKTLSGDFFYYFPNMNTASFIPISGASEDDDDQHQIILNQLGVVVADVVGKGVAASLEMFSVKTVFKLLHQYWFSPKELVTRLNDMSADSHLFSKYVPLIYATVTYISQSQYALRYVNAGHEYGVIIRASGETIILDQGGAPAGMDKDELFVETEIVLHKNDAVFLFTDGCTDVKSPNGDSIGFDELLPILHLATQQPSYDIARFVRNRLSEFQGNTPQTDDMTIVAFFVC